MEKNKEIIVEMIGQEKFNEELEILKNCERQEEEVGSF